MMPIMDNKVIKKIVEALKKDIKLSKTAKIVLLVLIGILVLGIFSVIKFYSIRSFDEFNVLQRVELAGNYSGQSFEVEADILKLDIPFNGQIQEDFEINEYPTLYQVIANGYVVIIETSNENFTNEEYSKKDSRSHLDATSYNEYIFKLFQKQTTVPSFFKPYLLIRKDFYHELERYLQIPILIACKYSSYERDNYAFTVSFDNLMTSDIDYDRVSIDIFDMKNNYDNVSSISILKYLDSQNAQTLTAEEILFIIDSIEIDDN